VRPGRTRNRAGRAAALSEPDATSGGAEFSEALQGFGPSLLSVLDAMRRRREYRVLTVGTSGAKTPRAAGAPMIQRGLVELPLFGGALQRGRRGVGVDGGGDGVEVAGTDLALVLDG